MYQHHNITPSIPQRPAATRSPPTPRNSTAASPAPPLAAATPPTPVGRAAAAARRSRQTPRRRRRSNARSRLPLRSRLRPQGWTFDGGLVYAGPIGFYLEICGGEASLRVGVHLTYPYSSRVQAVRVRLELRQPIHADVPEQQHGGHGQPLALRSHGHREYEEAEGGREEAMILQHIIL